MSKSYHFIPAHFQISPLLSVVKPFESVLAILIMAWANISVGSGFWDRKKPILLKNCRIFFPATSIDRSLFLRINRGGLKMVKL